MSRLWNGFRNRTVSIQNAFHTYISGYSSRMWTLRIPLERRSSEWLHVLRASNGCKGGDAQKL
jgi:hypothetical protein